MSLGTSPIKPFDSIAPSTTTDAFGNTVVYSSSSGTRALTTYSTTATNPVTGPQATPNCPSEALGHIYSNERGFAYTIMCGKELVLPGGYGGVEAGNTISFETKDNLAACISACDLYNTMHFTEGRPCLGVSFNNTSPSSNCFLKNDVSYPRPADGMESAKLVLPDIDSSVNIPLPTTSLRLSSASSIRGNGSPLITGAGSGGGTGSGPYVVGSTITATTIGTLGPITGSDAEGYGTAPDPVKSPGTGSGSSNGGLDDFYNPTAPPSDAGGGGNQNSAAPTNSPSADGVGGGSGSGGGAGDGASGSSPPFATSVISAVIATTVQTVTISGSIVTTTLYSTIYQTLISTIPGDPITIITGGGGGGEGGPITVTVTVTPSRMSNTFTCRTTPTSYLPAGRSPVPALPGTKRKRSVVFLDGEVEDLESFLHVQVL